ncbi:D-amino-acid oxidase-like isoform X2 [Limulus polyphemus]|uniref:D-amino-acid oxidase-like isoform X2 n=1 Tax=Limulus polyphemus TaxID=6850 RepID=A0ABM1BR76_LIMPO|nr:D-amino-acid oxidase-like isoform X2 [Limulus polyphemus]
MKVNLLEMERKQVAIVGAGIIGVTTAVRAIETVPGIEATIISDKFSPNTTGDGAAGFWNPYLLEGCSPEKIELWCQETFSYLLNLLQSPDSSTNGIGLVSGYILSEHFMERPSYAKVFLEYRDLTKKELEFFGNKYKYGVFVTSIYVECSKLLPQLMKSFQAKGGKIVQRKINKLSELAGEYDIVINCTGVEAARVVPDPDIRPIRGQVFRVKAPWVKHIFLGGEDFYILPNTDTVVLGGTRQAGDWNKDIYLEDSKKIWKGCCELIPSLQHAEIVKEWVGLRPGCSKGPKLSREVVVGSNGKKIQVIHHYGHGGSGITVFWGTAGDVMKLLQKSVSELEPNIFRARL